MKAPFFDEWDEIAYLPIDIKSRFGANVFKGVVFLYDRRLYLKMQKMALKPSFQPIFLPS